MERQHIDITKDLDDEAVVHAVFDLRDEEIGAAAHAYHLCLMTFLNPGMNGLMTVVF